MRRSLVLLLVLCAAVAAIGGAAPARDAAAAGPALNRPFDPVVLTGADVPTLNGIAPGLIVAFRFSVGWQQIPVQVDERDLIEFAKVYNFVNTYGDGVFQEQYTDAGTFTGADSNAMLDSNDEIAFMAKDAGVSTTVAEPPGVVPGTGVQVAISDALDGSKGFVYLFRSDGSLSPGAGQQYVTYTFNLLSGPYLTTYNTADGFNPENSVATTPYYSHHFADRWINDELHVTAGGATGVDVLDRHKNLFAPGNCVRSEDTFSDAEGAFVINKSGPVRAIRSYLGANSGPMTQREHVFYEHRQDNRTFLRVHPIGSMMDFFDYSPAATGMTYYNSLNTGGVTIDGNPETPTSGALQWEMVTGTQGSVVSVPTFDTNISGFAYTSYYLDDSTPPVTQCTGDALAYGSSGYFINQSIPCSDLTPGFGCTNYLASVGGIAELDATALAASKGSRGGVALPAALALAILALAGAAWYALRRRQAQE